MTTTVGHWRTIAACADTYAADFYAETASGQQRAITTYCTRCPVRAECLADALAMPAHQDQGVRGGLTSRQRHTIRQQPNLPTGQDPVTIAALRRLLDEEHPLKPQPTPRPPRPRRNPTMYTPPAQPDPAAVEKPAVTVEPEPLSEIHDLLAWAEQHPDAAIRKHAEAASTALTVIRQRHAADAELATVEREAKELRERLAELEARARDLRPQAAKAKPARDYDPATVRAWAKEQGLEVPGFGRLPKAVLEAWRNRGAA